MLGHLHVCSSLPSKSLSKEVQLFNVGAFISNDVILFMSPQAKHFDAADTWLPFQCMCALAHTTLDSEIFESAFPEQSDNLQKDDLSTGDGISYLGYLVLEVKLFRSVG